MDFKEHVPFGKTGVMVSRIALASGYGVPTASIEKAFHEYGINYFWISFLMNRHGPEAVRHLASSHRDDIRIALALPGPTSLFLQRHVERWLRKLRIDQIDFMIIQGQDKPPGPKLIDRIHMIKQSGKVRFVGMSSHTRPLFGQIARNELDVPLDFFQIRYNAVHTGAEKDIFPHLPSENRPGIKIFTATCWRKLLKPRLMPPGEKPLAPADCYRFVLSHPDVDVCATGPSTAEQLEDNLKALDAGPLDDDEMARIRRIGKHIYGK